MFVSLRLDTYVAFYSVLFRFMRQVNFLFYTKFYNLILFHFF